MVDKSDEWDGLSAYNHILPLMLAQDSSHRLDTPGLPRRNCSCGWYSRLSQTAPTFGAERNPYGSNKWHSRMDAARGSSGPRFEARADFRLTHYRLALICTLRRWLPGCLWWCLADGGWCNASQERICKPRMSSEPYFLSNRWWRRQRDVAAPPFALMMNDAFVQQWISGNSGEASYRIQRFIGVPIGTRSERTRGWMPSTG